MTWLSRGKVAIGIVVGIVGAVAALLVLPTGASHTPSAFAASDSSSTTGITVSGLGKVFGTPNTLNLQMGVSATRPDVSEALATANADLNKVITTLKTHTVAGKDIQTSNLSVNPQYAGGSHPYITGFNVTEQLNVTLRNLKTAGTILGSAISAGGNDVQVNNVSVALTDDDALINSARSRAFTDAKEKAQQYAQLSGRALGKVISISEQTDNPQPVGIYNGAVASSAGPAESAVNVQAGQQEVDVNVDIVWAFA